MSEIPKISVPTIAIAQSSARFPVRRIFCVGQNYAEHAREMGSDPKRQPPFFFSKPADAVIDSGRRLRFPSRTTELHHEVELVVALAAGGTDVQPQDATALIFGFAVGIDLTRRDLQAQAKKLTRGIPPAAGAITLCIDGEVRQSGDLKDMIWSVADIIGFLSTYVAVAAGDLIFTGTPAGVGPILRGEHLHGAIAGVEPIDVLFE